MKQSKELTQFYQEYLAWIKDGAWQDYSSLTAFTRGSGLCKNLYCFALKHSYEPFVLGDEMKAQFTDAGLVTDYPFNRDCREYELESFSGNSYINEKRIEWVRNHAKAI